MTSRNEPRGAHRKWVTHTLGLLLWNRKKCTRQFVEKSALKCEASLNASPAPLTATAISPNDFSSDPSPDKLSMSRRPCSIQSHNLAPAGISSQLEPTTSCSKGPEQTICVQGKDVKINIQKSSVFLDNCHPSAEGKRKLGTWWQLAHGTARIWNAPARELHENLHTSRASALCTLLWWVCFVSFFCFVWIKHATVNRSSDWLSLAKAWIAIIPSSNSC